MIKLVITSDSISQLSRSFEFSPIIIGKSQSTSADLKLDDPSLEDRHLQILSQKVDGKSVFFVQNLANDPFSTLNGLSFGKQPIHTNDVLQVGDITIRIEIENQPETPHQPIVEKIPSEKMLPKVKLAEAAFTNALRHPKQPVESAPSLASGLKTHSFQSQQTTTSAPSGTHQSQKLSLKDYYLSEYDEENEHVESNRDASSKSYLSAQLSKRWRFFLIVLSGLFSILAIAACMTYLWVSDQSGEEEIEASRGLADVAMALTYAQLKNVHPQNQNWSHHEFLKNNLYAIIAPGYIPLADCDSHGQFANCPYHLRIHTSADGSHFIVIAQPAPSVLQWLIPKGSIVIDSNSMEMRKIKDIKALNRLIVNANSLDGANGIEISNLIKQGSLIPLSTLVDAKENHGFTPPKALALIHPGAENLIYNAPRYYMLGESLLTAAVSVVGRNAGPSEMLLLQHELNLLLKYTDIVLYSSEGIQNALEAQKALAIIAPHDKFIIAYLQVNSKGSITNSHMLIDDPTGDYEIADNVKEKVTEKEPEQLLPTVDSKQNLEEHRSEDRSRSDHVPPVEEPGKHIDTEDPLFLLLATLKHARHTTLKPISEEIVELLKNDSHAPQPDFTAQLAKLHQKYLGAYREEQDKLDKKFAMFDKDYFHLPASTIADFIKAAELEAAFHDYLKGLSLLPQAEQISRDQVMEQIKMIDRSQTWPELENAVVQTNQLLRFGHIPDEKILISYQKAARLIVTQKLNQFILTSDGTTANDFAPDYLQALSNILKHAWIVDPETYDFYIDEFELREPLSG